MLSTSRVSLTLGLRVAGRRMLCAPALTTETLQSTIAELKEKMDSKYVLPYTREKLATDLEAGSVDSAALKQMFGFNENVMKHVLKGVSKYNENKLKIAENEKTTIDWEHYESTIDDPVVGKLKAAHEMISKDMEAGPIAKHAAGQEELIAKVKDAFEGSDGVFATARKMEAASQAGMEDQIKSLEALGSQITGLKEQTIAEVLESDPEMRKDIEEEMKNHQWGV